MCDRTGKVIDHELEYRLDLVLSVSGIVSQSRVLHNISKVNSRRSKLNIPIRLGQGSYGPST